MPPEETSDLTLCRLHEVEIRKLNRAIYGHNGVPGLLANSQENSKSLKKIEGSILWISRAIIGTCLALVVVALWNLILTHGPSIL